MIRADFTALLTERASELGVPVDSQVAARLTNYFELLSAWNSRINLTGLNLDDPFPHAVDRLLLEPALAARLLEVKRDTRLIDIGSGGGSPAIPIALTEPGMSLVMVESRTRKSVFLREAARALGIEDCRVLTTRFEDVCSDADAQAAWDLVTVRAVRVGPKELGDLTRIVAPGGKMAFFRGETEADDEIFTGSAAYPFSRHPLLSSLGGYLAVKAHALESVSRETS